MDMTIEVTTVADIVKAVSAGRMGNRAAIEALQLRNYDELVETVHLNGYTMAGHRPAGDRRENALLLAEACGKPLSG
jgi:pyridoxal/pyridoxine/pyridoxamine kinase